MSKFQNLITLLLAITLIAPMGAQSAPQSSDTPTTGIALKKPVFGGACRLCPWGAMAQAVKDAMQFNGYDVKICHNCNAAAIS